MINIIFLRMVILLILNYFSCINIEWFHGDLVIRFRISKECSAFSPLMHQVALAPEMVEPQVVRWVDGKMKYQPHVVLPSPGNHVFFFFNREIIPKWPN